MQPCVEGSFVRKLREGREGNQNFKRSVRAPQHSLGAPRSKINAKLKAIPEAQHLSGEQEYPDTTSVLKAFHENEKCVSRNIANIHLQ